MFRPKAVSLISMVQIWLGKTCCPRLTIDSARLKFKLTSSLPMIAPSVLCWSQIWKTFSVQHLQLCHIPKMKSWPESSANKRLGKKQSMSWFQEALEKDINETCKSAWPLHNASLRKPKIIENPKFQFGKLTELHAKGIFLERPLEMSQVLTLNKLMDMS